LVVKEIVEVLYSPVKAFKKVIEKPDFKGVLIILLLVIGATVALQFVYNSKQYYEIRALDLFGLDFFGHNRLSDGKQQHPFFFTKFEN
jgi:hypothetical protein